jgi:hypothetical protein
MSGYNLPDGCSDYDLPGYCDIEVCITAYCDACERDVVLEDVTVDGRGGSNWDADCPTEGCDGELSGVYEPDGRE